MKLLVIEDDVKTAALMQQGLSADGFGVDVCSDGALGLAEASKTKHDAIILDVTLPSLDGWTVLTKLREIGVMTPVLMVTARDAVEQRVKGLSLGADDYIVKPFGVPELLARMRVALRNVARRNAGTLETSCTIGPLRIELEARRVFCAGEVVHLTPLEFKLLAVLVAHCGKIVTHRQLLTEVWGPNAAEDSGYLRVYMTHLRRKLDPGHGWPSLFRTEAGVGYGLVAPEELEGGESPRAQ